MKVAILSESPTDEAVVRILAQAVLGYELELHQPRLSVRVGGWTQLISTASLVIRQCYFNSHDVDGLIVVLDSDDTLVVDTNHQLHPDARLTQLRRELRNLCAELNAKALRSPLRLAIGMAVPSLEAWLRCGVDPQVNEAAWCRAQQTRQFAYDRKQLKIDKYGSTRNIDFTIATANARRLAQDIQILRRHFPIGFGNLADDLGQWRE